MLAGQIDMDTHTAAKCHPGTGVLTDTGDVTTLKGAYLGSTPEDGGLSLFIALRWMQRPGW